MRRAHQQQESDLRKNCESPHENDEIVLPPHFRRGWDCKPERYAIGFRLWSTRTKGSPMSGNKEKENSAARLLRIITSAQQVPSSSGTGTAAWCQIFQITEVDERRKERKAAMHLDALHKEIELTTTALDNMGVPRYLHESTLHVLMEAISPTKLRNSWVLGIGQHDIVCLRFLAYILDDEEELIAAAEIADLLQTVIVLRTQVAEADLPTVLRDFLMKHLEAMEQALELYPVTGLAPVAGAVEGLGGNAIVREKQLDEAMAKTSNEQKSLVAKIGRLASTVTEVVKAADATSKFAGYMLEHVPKLLSLTH